MLPILGLREGVLILRLSKSEGAAIDKFQERCCRFLDQVEVNVLQFLSFFEDSANRKKCCRFCNS